MSPALDVVEGPEFTTTSPTVLIALPVRILI